MNRVFLELGPITIYWYSVLILIAVLIGYQIILRYFYLLLFQQQSS